MYAEHPHLSPTLRDHHAQAMQQIAQPGAFFSGTERLEMVRVAREALDCELCRTRKAALSPNIEGRHDGPGNLEDVVVEVVHRIRTDPGRISKGWFDRIMGYLSKPQYVEIVSVVASSVIVDTLHNALGQGVPTLPVPSRGRPTQEINRDAVEDGAWVPILEVTNGPTETNQPSTWNITRALGLVPSALELFFTTFRPHYALQDIHLSISQAQAEFVAARVSALNECFY